MELIFLMFKESEEILKMVTIKNEKIEMEEALKNKIEFICGFCNTSPIIYNGSIKMIEHTNLQYIEPHRIIIKGITFLAFNYSTDIYIGNLSKKIKLVELEDYIKNMA